MTPIERACIAVIDNLREQGDLMADCGDPEWAQVDGAFRVEPVVRAVLKAIREPNEAMIEVDALRPDGSFFAEDYWKAMIDTALQEG